MAVTIATAMCNTAKAKFLAGIFLAADTYKMALIDVTGTGTYGTLSVAYGTSTGAPTTTNMGTDECAASGTYADGGFTMTGYTAGATTTTSWIDWTTDPSWTSATLSSVGCMLYDDTVSGKPAISVHSFGGTITSTAGTFTITLPAGDASNALVRIG